MKIKPYKKGEYIKGKMFNWVNYKPLQNKNKIALLIPQFNEAKNKNKFIERLDYYKNISFKYKNLIDLILIDDGSTDESNNIINEYLQNNLNIFYYARVIPNANKVGALYLTTKNIEHTYIIFSDFDTDIENLDQIAKTCDIINENPRFMGCYFKMSPTKEDNWINKYQELEYALLRIIYRFHKADATVAVMPGAGSLYKRVVVNEIFSKHTGHRNGEDRESAIIGLNNGYKTFYEDKVKVITRPPNTYRSLINQRIRWNLGYLETIYFQSEYFIINIKKSTPFGLRFMFDMINISSTVIINPFLFILLIFSFKKFVIISLIYYVIKLIWISIWTLIGKNEIHTITNVYSQIILYPVIRVLVETPSWILALKNFLINHIYKKN